LSDDEAEDMLIIPDDENGQEQTEFKFYRFVDEVADYIYKKDKKGYVSLVEFDINGNSLTKKHKFKQCPALIISDITHFENTQLFLSKLDKVVELSEMFMKDRSIRDLSKMYHGFPKLVQPIVKCKKCQGNGYIGDVMCTDCQGTGRKSIKKISDNIDIPLEMLSENTSLDIKKIFVYITPDIATWDKQDDSLSALEVLINDCYWGTDNRKYTKGASLNSGIAETATKTMTNLQPVYSRLERTAEWAENVETKIIDFIATALYPTFKKSFVKYGRNYILESTEDLFQDYINNKKNFAPQYILTDYLERYFKSKYQNNPIELGIALKMIDVEPFVHYSLKECIENGVIGKDLQAKRYFSEWYATQKNEYLFAKTVDVLKTDLYTFAQSKQSDVPPAIN